MGSRVFGAIGLSLAVLVTACTSTTGGPGGVATASGGAPTGAAATASAVSKATCQTKKVTIAVPVTPPNVVHLTPYLADAFGYFKDENLTVELIRFDGGVGSLRASASGARDRPCRHVERAGARCDRERRRRQDRVLVRTERGRVVRGGLGDQDDGGPQRQEDRGPGSRRLR